MAESEFLRGNIDVISPNKPARMRHILKCTTVARKILPSLLTHSLLMEKETLSVQVHYNGGMGRGRQLKAKRSKIVGACELMRMFHVP